MKHVPLKPKALTIRHPWAFAILHLGKNVENRSFRTHHRGVLLIHAAVRPVPKNGRAMLAEYKNRLPSEERLRKLPLGCIVGVVELRDCIKNSQSKWADTGCWHWILKGARSLKPIECTGRLGLWSPPTPVLKRPPGMAK